MTMTTNHQSLAYIVELVILAEEERLRKLGVDVGEIDFRREKTVFVGLDESKVSNIGEFG